MSLDDLVTLNISSATATPTKPGFGTILIAAQKVPAGFTSRVKTYASLTEMVDAGFLVTDPAYLCAQRMKSQNPAIKNFKVGKRLLQGTQTVKLKVTSASAGEVYSVKINGVTVSYTVENPSKTVSVTFAEVGATGDTITRGTGSFVTDGYKPGMLLTVAGSVSNNFTGALIAAVSATVLTLDTQDLVAEGPVSCTLTAVNTVDSIATYLETLTEAVTDVSSSVVTDTITCVAPAGTLLDYKEWTSNLQLTETTTDPGIATDLAAILAYDGDWYGLALDSNSEAEINAAAAWVESAKKLFVANSSDYGCEDAGSTTDVMSDVKAAAYARTAVLYSRSQLLSYSGAAWMAKQFTQNPGSDTWAYKTLAGVTVDTITAGARSAILAKNGNVYTAVSGINITENGKSGAGEWLDVTRFVDWLRAEIQFRVYSALVNNSKIPFTDLGIDLIVSIIDGALDYGVQRGGLAKGTTSVEAPKAADVSAGDRAARLLSDVVFSGRLAGAIHTLEITGRVSA